MPRKGASAALEQETSLSQADTEPLSFEDEENETTELNGKMTDLVDEDAPGSIQASLADTSMEDINANTATSNRLTGNANEQDEEGDDADAVGSDEEGTMRGEEDNFEDSRAQDATNEEDAGAMQRSNTGAAFSDESELTDESDDDDDAEGEVEEEDDDDEMGGDDEDDEDEDAEGEDEEDDEDEAAKGLAALTAAAEQDGAAQNAGAEVTSGLDGLAVLAAAGAGDADQLNADGSDSESATSSRSPSTIHSRHGRLAAKPRLGSRLNEVMLASEPTSDQDDLEDGEEEDGAGENDLDDNQQDGEDDESQQGSQLNKRPKNHSREMSSLGHLASAAKRSATRPGPAAGLLAGAPSITIDEAPSGAASVASSREASPKLDDKEDEDGDQKGAKGDEEDEDEKDKEVLETPILETEEAVAEEETSTDEAAIRRQEAMEALTKIEIGFAVLRDKLYVERMDEISKESEMILEGTHPDLIYLTNFIEARRERRLKLVEMWFEEQQKQYERVAHTEEAATWNNWRNEVVQLRKDKLDDVSRKRRKLDREKRTLDGPRPARRHQIFETELVRNPDYDAIQAKTYGQGKAKRKSDPRQQELEDLEEMGAYVAYPDLRGAEEGEAWMDLERMGVQPDVRLMPGMNYYRMDEMGVDPYGNMYVMDGGAQQPPPGMELLPPFPGGPAPGGMMLERGGFDGRDRGMQPGMVVDGYGPAPPANQFGGPPPPGPRGNGGPRMQNDNGMGGASSSKKRAGTPSGSNRTPKQSGAILDDRRKNEGQGMKRPRSPGQAPGSRKPVGAGPGGPTSNPNRNVSQNASQRNFDGMMQGGKMPYPGGGGGPPRDMHDERYYDGPLPPAHMGGPPPPGAYGNMPGHGGGKMPSGAGAGFPPGHMMGSPGQPVSQQLGPAPPPPPMNHPMHGPPGSFPPNRRSDAIYPH
ncbi:uncharacterized protein FA14DRAFT_51305 [Meira miltonrushii]|uniref:Sds3-like protein n=1 Tax=Meira miltonrushii TaxID=1280837 RepID=A0A316VET9_9BASI|nr:uncharacterized protein FA14DRAFT_51305 [Meira miltonrushii]PWN36050.1 hypothetical protein FA14DRAFT_51305 [Meira miltonrushii]